MNLVKSALLTFVFSFSTVAFSDGGAGRMLTRMMDSRQTTLSKMAETETASVAAKISKIEESC